MPAEATKVPARDKRGTHERKGEKVLMTYLFSRDVAISQRLLQGKHPVKNYLIFKIYNHFIQQIYIPEKQTLVSILYSTLVSIPDFVK